MTEEILTKAIHKEIQIRDFYRDVSGKIDNKKGRKQMLALSNGEDEHRDILSSRYKALFGKNFVPDPGFPADSSLDARKTTVYDQATAVDVVSIGITSENNAISLYRGLIDEVSDDEDIKILKKLIKFEEKHKKRLQRMYTRLQKFNYWQNA
jgi:rubrerythrin